MANQSESTAFLRRALWIMFALSLIGVAFAGTLTFREFQGTAASCPAVGTPGTIFGYPACVYGLAFYIALALISGFALLRTREMATRRTSDVAPAS
ncbi:MAG TPA: hypothetical protein VFP26_04840 [Gemmatimonadaceae bacterium]|jgi:uncharacterized membrane protein|nr:hypothetical protein [Gemmatimonadaceae bacterium]